MLVLLSENVAMRMRDLGSKCNVVEIYVRDNELSGFTRRRKLDNPTNVSIEIARIAFDLFKRNYSWPKPLRGIGVRGADLCPADCAVQLGFFSNEEKREKLEHIDKAVDTLRQRYGMWVKAVAAVAGSVIYRFIIALALRANVPSECLKLISAVIVALAIAAPALKAKADFRRRRANAQKGGARHA